MNQHVVDITIVWPDGKWEQKDEQAYLDSCLEGVREYFQKNPIQNRESKFHIFNSFGRAYADVHINPVKSEVGK